MQFFPILQELERIRTITDKQESDGWARRKGRLGRKGIPYYIDKWLRRWAKFCSSGERDGTNG